MKNIINKVKHNIKLTEIESLDIAFISKYIPKNEAEDMIKSSVYIFNNAIIENIRLKLEVRAVLGAMIHKNIKDPKEHNKLMEEINMGEIGTTIDELIEEETEEIRKELENNEKKMESMSKKLENNEKEMKSMSKKLENNEKEMKSMSNKMKKYEESKIQTKNDLTEFINEVNLSKSDKLRLMDIFALLL